MPGMKAPSYMSPTDLPSWSAITMSTSEGGMICARVPDAAVIAVAHHDRQRDQPHGNHRGGDHAGGGGEQRADENDRVSEAAAHGAEQLPDSVEQVLRHAGSFEHQPHKREERNRQQRVVAHHPVDAFWQGLQEVGDEQTELDTEQREDQPDRAEREGRRITEQQKECILYTS